MDKATWSKLLSTFDAQVQAQLTDPAPVPVPTPTPTPTPVPAGYHPPYSPNFAINKPIPSSMATHPDSVSIVSTFANNAKTSKVSLSNHLEVPTVYFPLAVGPLYSASVGGVTYSFPLPINAVTGEGSDHPMEVVTGAYEYRFWEANIDHSAKVVHASGAGAFHWGPTSNGLPYTGQGTGSGLSYLAGLIMAEDFKAGEIRHAIRIAYSGSDQSGLFMAPATKSDAKGAGKMAMGQRLQLDATVNPDSRTVPSKADTSPETKFLRMFCRALRDYGLIVLDTTGLHGINIYMEHEATANWNQLIGSELYGSYGWLVRSLGTPSDGLTRKATDGVPWERLRVLESSAW